ncbi:S-layer homology domain-containing protein [Ureibacillus aquaedulcis]|uniref:S-layer homology domain-containing protein n=1 Tax=Ureibacillus aquaedulcis TaxID=3058421 RepID=A0ABT8GML9_9BACL|nr:S-layer homology domain-containing protein [Ureibacillus sp. BA0131]MDN4492176.1 S-layer homology domain-containing protein [Ureibacillus sp. BA0131]
MNHLFKKVILSFTLIFMIGHTVEASSVREYLYSDVSPNHWAYESISTMKDLNIMPVKSYGKFNPNELVTRADAVQFIFNALKLEKTTETGFLFKDIPNNATYKHALFTLTSLGIIENAEFFHPNDYLTRAQLCKIISLAFDIAIDQKNHTSFRDVTSSHWAKNYIESLADIEIIKGTSKDTFSPNQKVTRAQMAAFLDRSMTFNNELASNEKIYDFLQKDYINTIDYHPDWSSKVVKLVNLEREKQGLSPLQNDSKLAQLAIVKGNDMLKRKYFEHYSPFYGYAWDMAGLFDYSFTSIGENLARNATSPEAAIRAWLKSTSHKNTMLNKNYTNTGVACVESDDGQIYWVQLFSKK